MGTIAVRARAGSRSSLRCLAPGAQREGTRHRRDRQPRWPIIEGFHCSYELVAHPEPPYHSSARRRRDRGAQAAREARKSELNPLRRCAAVINTPTLGKTVDRDGFLIRRAAVEARVPCLTSLDTALAVVTALRASAVATNVAPLSEYRAAEPVVTTAAD